MKPPGALAGAMECFEEGIFDLQATGGRVNVEAVRELLTRIAMEEGVLGGLWAEG